MPGPLLLVALGALGFLAASRNGKTTVHGKSSPAGKGKGGAAAASSGPPINPNTGFVVFSRFHDLDLTAGDLVQILDKNGAASTLTVTGAQSETWGPAFLGTPSSGGAPVAFASEDVASLAPAGTTPTATSGWVTTSTGLPPVLQAYNTTDASSLTVGAYVRLQDTRGSGTGIVAQITALPATGQTGALAQAPGAPDIGQITGNVTAYQGAIVPPPDVSFGASNVAYVAADASGAPPPGASVGNFQPLTNPAFEASTAGFVLSDVVPSDIVLLKSIDGTAITGVVSAIAAGGITAQETSGPAPGTSILFDVTEIQAIATAQDPNTFHSTASDLRAATAGTTPAAAAAGGAPAKSIACCTNLPASALGQTPYAGAAPAFPFGLQGMGQSSMPTSAVGSLGGALEGSFGHSVPASPASRSTVLKPGDFLSRGEEIHNGVPGGPEWTLSFQTNGDVVIYRNEQAVWHTDTQGSNAEHLVMQGDGNLVLYDQSGHVVFWATNTSGQPGTLASFQSDGNLVLYRNGRAIWASASHGTNTSGLAALGAGAALAFGAGAPPHFTYPPGLGGPPPKGSKGMGGVVRPGGRGQTFAGAAPVWNYSRQ